MLHPYGLTRIYPKGRGGIRPPLTIPYQGVSRRSPSRVLHGNTQVADDGLATKDARSSVMRRRSSGLVGMALFLPIGRASLPFPAYVTAAL